MATPFTAIINARRSTASAPTITSPTVPAPATVASSSSSPSNAGPSSSTQSVASDASTLAPPPKTANTSTHSVASNATTLHHDSRRFPARPSSELERQHPPRRAYPSCPPQSRLPNPEKYKSAPRFRFGCAVAFSLMIGGSIISTYAAFSGHPDHRAMVKLRAASYILFPLGYSYLNYVLLRLINKKSLLGLACRLFFQVDLPSATTFGLFYSMFAGRPSGWHVCAAVGFWPAMTIMALLGPVYFGSRDDQVRGWESGRERRRRRNGLL